jgi:hypothetical protein
MADFFKGLAGGFGTGLQFGQAMRQRRMEDELAQAYAKPQTSQGYTAQDGQQLEELAKTGAYDIVPQYAPSEDPQKQGVFTGYRAVPKAGLDLQGDVPADGAYINVAPRQVQDYGGQRVAGQFDPTQLRGLQMQEAARVLGSYGDVRGAAALQSQAAEQEYRAEDRAYQARIRPEQEKQLRLQGVLTEGQIADRQKLRDRETKVEAVDTDVAGFVTKRLTGPDGEMRPPSMDDNIAALQYRATALQKAGLTKEATDSLKDYQGFAVNQIRLDEAQRNSQLGAVAAAIAQGDLGPAKAFYDRFVIDGAKVVDMKTDPKTGAITVSRVRDDGTKLPDKVIKGGANELLAALNSFKDPMSLYNFSQNEFSNNLKLEELGLRKRTEARQAAEAKVTPLEKTVQGLKNLGVKVTPSMIESLGGLDKADSPRLKAQLSIIEKAVAEGTLKPEEGLKRVDTLFAEAGKAKQATRDQAEIVSGIKAEAKAGKLPALIDFLKTKRGYTDAALAPLFEEAGIEMPASATPATAPATAPAPAPAVSPRTGVSSGQQQYGPLTPMATIEADARAGIPAAVAYLKQMADRDRARTENAIRAAQGE